jgi:hypothetical protein
MTPIGAKRWAVSAGQAPSTGTGDEPEFTSRDLLSLLNAGEAMANVRLHVVYASRGEVGPFRLGVAPRRLRRVRINDLIFPEAVRLDEPYSLLVRSDVPIVVQFGRLDSRALANTGFVATAWGEPTTSP